MLLTLKVKKQECPNVISFIFTPDHPCSWQAGQFMKYHLKDPQPDQRLEERFFTIASAPFEGDLILTTKFVPDDGSTFKKDLKNLNIGDQLEVEGPKGGFIVPDVFITEGKKLCFIAGGIGITPFRAILLDLSHNQKTIDVTLLYANRDENIVFKDELETIAQRYSSLNIHYYIDPQRIDEPVIRSLIPDLQNQIFYISGPEPMVQAFEKMLSGMEAPEDHVKRDYFPGYQQI